MFDLKTHEVYQEIQINKLPTLLGTIWQWEARLYTREGEQKELIAGVESGNEERIKLRDMIIYALHEHFDEKYPQFPNTDVGFEYLYPPNED